MGDIIYLDEKRQLVCKDERVENIFFYGAAPMPSTIGIKISLKTIFKNGMVLDCTSENENVDNAVEWLIEKTEEHLSALKH